MFAVRRAQPLRPSALCLLALLSCKGEDKPAGSDGGGEGGDGGATLDSPIFSVSEGTTASVAGLSCPAHVLRTEGNVPHIFAHDRADLAFATGYVFATDRYFFLDLARRLSLGRVSALLGDAGLESDLAARATGMTHVADVLLAGFTPEEAADIDAYAAGVNAYIEEVRAGRLPPPSELVLAAPLVGASSPIELMEPFSRRDLAGALASLVYELGFETEDVGATRRLAELNAGVYAPEVPGYALREAGAGVHRGPVPDAPCWALA